MARVNAVYRAIKILKLLKNNKKNNGLTLTEISNLLDIPKSSTYDIIDTLKEEGFIKKSNKDLKTYSLGISLYELGAAYLSQIDLNFIVRPYLENLMNELHTTAFLAVEDNGQIVYLDKVEPPTIGRTTLPLGTRKEMYNTSLGKALLARYSEKKIKQIISDSSPLKPKTEKTITSLEALMEELEKTRQRGYAIDDREDNDNVFCLGTPIINENDQPIAAISLSFLYYEIKDKDIDKIAQKLVNAAVDISKQLGYSGGIDLYY